MDHAGIDKLLDRVITQAIDLHGATRGKVFNALLALRRSEQTSATACHRFAFGTHHLGATLGALCWHLK